MDYIYPCMPNRAYFGTPLFEKLDRDSKYIAEVKRNGWRCLAIKQNNTVELWTRHKTPIQATKNSSLAGVKSSLMYLPNNTVIDGELLDRRDKQIKDTFYAFDILAINGKTLWNEPLSKRRKALESILKTGQHILLAEQFRVGRSFLYLKVIENGEEGIVFKRSDSIYPISTTKCLTNPYWVKIKQDEKHFVKKEVVYG